MQGKKRDAHKESCIFLGPKAGCKKTGAGIDIYTDGRGTHVPASKCRRKGLLAPKR
jgi:hypothetical protein